MKVNLFLFYMRVAAMRLCDAWVASISSMVHGGMRFGMRFGMQYSMQLRGGVRLDAVAAMTAAMIATDEAK